MPSAAINSLYREKLFPLGGNTKPPPPKKKWGMVSHCPIELQSSNPKSFRYKTE